MRANAFVSIQFKCTLKGRPSIISGPKIARAHARMHVRVWCLCACAYAEAHMLYIIFIGNCSCCCCLGCVLGWVRNFRRLSRSHSVFFFLSRHTHLTYNVVHACMRKRYWWDERRWQQPPPPQKKNKSSLTSIVSSVLCVRNSSYNTHEHKNTCAHWQQWSFKN